MSKYQPYGNVKMRGKLSKRLSCTCCTAVNKKKYSEEYDAYYDEETNECLEEPCGDENCGFCSERPERPL